MNLPVLQKIKKWLSELDKRNKYVLIFASYLLIGSIGFLDYITGYEFAVVLFYLIPISMITWRVGRLYGIAASCTSTIGWTIAIIAQGFKFSHPLFLVWNAFIEFGFFLVVTFLLSALKKALQNQTDLVQLKELILKEVHHRIKNNMAAMIGLLSLQAKTQAEPAAIKVLEDAKGRLQGMTVLYDKLYRANQFLEMPISDYLPTLVHEIIQDFPHHAAVTIAVDVAPLPVPANFLATLGIIVNELITNIMKYAFSGRDHGLITVAARRVGNKTIIIIADNGIGLPAAVSPGASSGFGLHLIGMLMQQLSGTMHIDRENGTRYQLEFSL